MIEKDSSELISEMKDDLEEIIIKEIKKICYRLKQKSSSYFRSGYTSGIDELH